MCFLVGPGNRSPLQRGSTFRFAVKDNTSRKGATRTTVEPFEVGVIAHCQTVCAEIRYIRCGQAPRNNSRNRTRKWRQNTRISVSSITKTDISPAYLLALDR